MKGIEELECTTVARWSWNFLEALSYVLSTITRVYHIERSVFELSRTKDMSSIQFTRPLNQIELTKNIRVEKNRMLYFRPSSTELGHRTKWNCLQKITNGTKSFNGSSAETVEAIWRFGFFHYCISIFWVNSKYWLFPGKSVPRKNINSLSLEA